MKKIMAVSILFFLFGCTATTQKVNKSSQNYPPEGFIRRATIGIGVVQHSDGRIEILAADEKGGAAKAGIKAGDILKAIDGRPVKKRLDVINFIANKQSGENVLVTVQRNGIRRDFRVKLQFTDFPQIIDTILRILWEGKKVSLVIMIGEINFVVGSAFPQHPQIEEWRKATRSQSLVNTENWLLNAFKPEINFSIVDRNRVEEILEELKFGQTGFVSEVVRNRLGEILGATHILFLELSRYSDRDVTAQRLIEVETGKVLAGAVFSRPLEINKNK